MNRFGKLIHGSLHYAPQMLIHENKKVFNPHREMYLEHGFLPVVESAVPATDEEHFAIPHWEEQNDRIVQTWEIIEISDYEATSVDYEDALKEVGIIEEV